MLHEVTCHPYVHLKAGATSSGEPLLSFSQQNTPLTIMCSIPASPDITGIGVRTAIYIQNLLCFLPAIWALWDGDVTREELESAETQTTTNLVLAFAILISSIVQALTLGLSNFHANIVLSMSWMNNTNAFVYFLLYIQHKRSSIKPTWTAWYAHVRTKIDILIPRHGTMAENSVEVNGVTDGLGTGNSNPNCAGLDASGRQGAKILLKRFVILLGSLHLTLMSGLGIWLWRNLLAFGNRKSGAANECGASSAFVVILGRAVPLAAGALRICSLALYALFLIPGLNLVLPIALFLCLFFWCHRPHAVDNSSGGSTGKRAALPVFAGLLVLLVVDIIFIVNIEATLKRNKGLQKGEDEGQWGFGQILAILLLLLPLRDLVETLLARRIKRRRAETAQDLMGAIESQELDAVFRAVAKGGDLDKGLDTKDPRGWEWMLIPAVLKGYFDIVKVLVRRTSTHVNYVDQSGSTALIAACSLAVAGPNKERIVRLLLQQPNMDCNIADCEGQTALMKAFLAGHEPLVQLLLDHRPTNVNQQNKDGDSVLHLASHAGNTSTITALLQRTDIDTDIRNHEGRTALMRASSQGHQLVVQQLLNHQLTNVNLQDKDGDSALRLASLAGHTSTVASLLQCTSIDTNVCDHEGRTALMSASSQGHQPVVQQLLDHQLTDVNLQDKDGDSALRLAALAGHTSTVAALLQCTNIDTNVCNRWQGTALMIASLHGHEGIVQQLLDHQSTDVNLQDEDGDSALHFASCAGHTSTVMALLRHTDINIDLRNRQRSTALMVASFYGRAIIVQQLLEHQMTDVNVQDKLGDSAIMDAARKGHLTIVESLINCPHIDTSLRNNDAQTALQLALESGHEQIVQLLSTLESEERSAHGTHNV